MKTKILLLIITSMSLLNIQCSSKNKQENTNQQVELQDEMKPIPINDEDSMVEADKSSENSYNKAIQTELDKKNKKSKSSKKSIKPKGSKKVTKKNKNTKAKPKSS
jgi:hypothetical protein